MRLVYTVRCSIKFSLIQCIKGSVQPTAKTRLHQQIPPEGSTIGEPWAFAEKSITYLLLNGVKLLASADYICTIRTPKNNN